MLVRTCASDDTYPPLKVGSIIVAVIPPHSARNMSARWHCLVNGRKLEVHPDNFGESELFREIKDE